MLCVRKAGVCTANNDILVFLIGLGEIGAESGLGISVKGKTSVSESGFRDLGLYVKSILDTGAAAKVLISKSFNTQIGCWYNSIAAGCCSHGIHCDSNQVSPNETLCPRRWQFAGRIPCKCCLSKALSMVQPPSEWL